MSSQQANRATELAVVTPIWKSEPSQDEVLRLALTQSSSEDTAHVFLHPEGLATHHWQQFFPTWNFRACNSSRFLSVQAYSRWLLDPEFYQQFANFTHILIAQLDSTLLQPLPRSLFHYDYVGAPWDPPWRVVVFREQMRIIRIAGRAIGRRIEVGNGGLSLRRTAALIRATTSLRQFASEALLRQAHEDALLAYYKRRLDLNIAPKDVADCLIDLRHDAGISTGIVGVHGLNSATPIASECIREFAQQRGLQP